MTTAEVIPHDPLACQAEKPNGQSFMTFGGDHKMVRCEAKPVYVVTEKAPGSDGKRGSMSVCAECYLVLLEQGHSTEFETKPIEGTA